MTQTHYPVIVIGGGQAGLSISHQLTQRGIDHLVFEKHRIGHAWREYRWDSFCLVTPNWQCKLPDFPYTGKDPEGFMGKHAIVEYIEQFAASFGAPVREGVSVTRLRRVTSDAATMFELETSAGVFTADQVVVAVGGYHLPVVPRMAERLPKDLAQIHSREYKNPQSMPDGDVLVIGSGQSGCQIAEDLHIAGRKVHLCVGGAPRVARRYRGKDVVEWLDLMGFYDLPVHKHPLKEQVRGRANHYVTGRDGGRDIDLRLRASEGMNLYGRLLAIEDGVMHFGQDLKQNLDKADETSESIKTSIDKFIGERGISAPTEPRYTPLWHPPEPAVTTLDLKASNIRSVIWSIGYRADFSWIEIPVFDGRGYPGHQRGVTTCEGLYFLGLPWLYTWGSGRFSGVARDAAYVADRIELCRSEDADDEVAVPYDGAHMIEALIGS
ncbi:MSMEG_0569 family flavin-dependent oxidoreductase [Humisphaera borealis]|uniref:MSMEG_0569 family flavin-dependent oxidoreductase n=1 Tax=Humisphaera borealis TaxID=2807512 RepID=A0A7M2WW08_9BACT|nr:MSMEG_0569 family flavin-dependent oxidoreductase [Humisphaera borealis]QOV89675.1 MSMEG_0569 family flavin-dependent oxidoreductase [Humisphaera borealis]